MDLPTSPKTPEAPPTPADIKARFIIPREYLRQMAAYMNVSESLLYQINRQGRRPTPRTAAQIEERTGIPAYVWLIPDLDTLSEIIYTYWYSYITGTDLTGLVMSSANQE